MRGWPADFVDAVRAAADIEDIASGLTKLERKGKRLQGLCPFHKEKTPSFSVDRERGLYYCFGCGKGGDAIGLHMETTGDDFGAAIEALARRFGVPVPVRQRHSDTSRERGLEGALLAAEKFFADELKRSSFARDYLRRRRIDDSLVERFGIGFAPDAWHRLEETLTARVPIKDLEAAGLVGRSTSGRTYDRFRNRLIFPIRSVSGRLLGFGGRTLGDDRAKYVNTAETAFFNKGTLLYGLDRARSAARECGQLLLVEGYFDVLAAIASGIEWTVASMGTSVTQQQAKLLARYADEIVVGFDGDRAGEAAFEKVMPTLLGSGLRVRRAQFPAGQDPDSLRLDEGPEAVRALVEGAPDALDLKVSRLPTHADLDRAPRRRAEAAEEMNHLLQAISDPLLRFSYARRIAERLGVPVELLQTGQHSRTLVREAQKTSDSARQEVHSLEERVLQLLLQEMGTAQSLDFELPKSAAFFEPACRTIYEGYLSLLTEGSSVGLAPREWVPKLLGRLGEGGAIDRLAPLLLQETEGPNEGELRDLLRKLDRRLMQRQLRELSNDLKEAQEQGDENRLELLLEQKADLSRQLHRSNLAGRDFIKNQEE